MKIALLEKIKTLYKGIKRKMAKEFLMNDENGQKYLSKLALLYVIDEFGEVNTYRTITKKIEEDIPEIYVLNEDGTTFELKSVTEIPSMLSYDTNEDRVNTLARVITQREVYKSSLDAQTETLTAVNRDLSGTKVALARVEKELNKSDTEIIDLKTELVSLDLAKVDLTKKLEEAKKSLVVANETNRANVVELTDQIEKIKNEYSKTEEALQESENEVRVLNETLDSVKTELKEVYAKKTDLESNLEVVTVANSALQDKVDDLVKDQASKTAEIEGLKTLNQSLNAKIEEMQSNSSELTRELISELDTFTNKITGIIAKI